MLASRLFLFCGIVLFVAGCGGGGKSASDSLASGRSALDRVVSGEDAPSPDRLDALIRLFRQAVQEKPDSPLAHFFMAICLTARVGWDVDGFLAGGSVPGNPGDASAGGPPAPPGRGEAARAPSAPGRPAVVGDRPPTPPDYPGSPPAIPPHYTLARFWQLDEAIANPFLLLHQLAPLADLRLGMVPFYGYPADEPSRRMVMLERLKEALEHLAKVEAHPEFEAELRLAGGAKSVKVGLPEVQLFGAYVHSLMARVSLSLAYHRDPGDFFPPLPPVVSVTNGDPDVGGGIDSPFKNLDKDRDGRLTPSEYLPPDPFLTLRDKTYLVLAQSSLRATVEAAEKGIAGVLKRESSTDFLLPNRPPVSDALTAMRDKALPLLRQAAEGPFEVDVPIYHPMPLEIVNGAFTRPYAGASSVFAPWPGGDIYPPEPPGQADVRVKINLAAWFERPPADLKALAPTLVLDAEGWPDPNKTVYPDPTFAGLFPDGLPPTLLF